MKVYIIYDEINVFEYNIHSISDFLKEFQNNLVKNKEINPNWKVVNKNVRKLLSGELENVVLNIKKSIVQEDMWLVNLIIPVIKNTCIIYIRTSMIPFFVSKKELGPNFLLDDINEMIAELRKTFKDNTLNSILIK